MIRRAAQDVFSEVVNNGGLIRAGRVDDSGGVVRLLGSGGAVVTTGDIDATGVAASDAGGRVELLLRAALGMTAELHVGVADAGAVGLEELSSLMSSHVGTFVKEAETYVRRSAEEGDGRDLVGLVEKAKRNVIELFSQFRLDATAPKGESGWSMVRHSDAGAFVQATGAAMLSVGTLFEGDLGTTSEGRGAARCMHPRPQA